VRISIYIGKNNILLDHSNLYCILLIFFLINTIYYGLHESKYYTRKGKPQVIGGRKAFRSIADVESAVVTGSRN